MSYKPTLTVSFVWHHLDAEQVQSTIEKLSCTLSRDEHNPFSRKMDIPLFYLKSHEGELAPKSYPVDDASSNIVIVFVSVNTACSGEWREYFQKLQSKDGLKLVFVSIDKNGLSHSDSLKGVNFLRAYDWVDELRESYSLVFILHEVFRFAFNIAVDHKLGENTSIKIFLSHAKIGETGVKFADQIRTFINNTNLRQFFDATSISPGFDFREEIIGHLSGSTILAILTDGYSSRFWCQKEVMAAKELERPIVIMNALEKYEDRSFPELTNAPVVRVETEDLSEEVILQVLSACLVETIRHNYVVNHLESLQKHGWLSSELKVLSRPLEFRTAIRNMRQGIAMYCYPEPPVYPDEATWHQELNIQAQTPLWAKGAENIFMGMNVGLSFSEVGCVEEHNFESFLPHNLVTRLGQELARHLLARGCKLLYGGDLRPGGITEFILHEASVLKSRNPRMEGVIDNYLAWPLFLVNDERMRELLADNYEILSFVKCSAPSELVKDEAVPIKPDCVEHRFIWSKSLTNMRVQLVESSNVRICGGGKRADFKGAMPGVLEEILLSIRRKKPLFLCGGFGGMVNDVTNLILNQQVNDALSMEWQELNNSNYRELQNYAQQSNSRVSYKNIVRELSNVSVLQLAEASGLPESSYVELMTTRYVENAVYLCLEGMKNLKRKGLCQ